MESRVISRVGMGFCKRTLSLSIYIYTYMYIYIYILWALLEPLCRIHDSRPLGPPEVSTVAHMDPSGSSCKPDEDDAIVHFPSDYGQLAA